jgi:hypothetical protein
LSFSNQVPSTTQSPFRSTDRRSFALTPKPGKAIRWQVNSENTNGSLSDSVSADFDHLVLSAALDGRYKSSGEMVVPKKEGLQLWLKIQNQLLGATS